MSATNVSVVIASAAGGDFLPRCLDSLKEQPEARDAEVIVVDRCGGETAARVEKNYRFAKVVRTEPNRRLSVPQLRRIGVSEAQGDIVAILEEHCVAPTHWIQTICSSFQPGDAAIGGPILDDDYARVQDWVVYFSEYHNYLPPWRDGDRYLLNGANIAYHRQTLLAFEDVLDSGYWEVVLHPRLAQKGRFRAVSQMGVYHTGPFKYGYYLSQRYLLSRVWGGTQRAKISKGKRLVYLVAAPLFPLLLLGRITHRVFASRHRIGRYLASVPLLIPVTGAYVWGEWVGYCVGVGDALERVE